MALASRLGFGHTSGGGRGADDGKGDLRAPRTLEWTGAWERGDLRKIEDLAQFTMSTLMRVRIRDHRVRESRHDPDRPV